MYLNKNHDLALLRALEESRGCKGKYISEELKRSNRRELGSGAKRRSMLMNYSLNMFFYLINWPGHWRGVSELPSARARP